MALGTRLPVIIISKIIPIISKKIEIISKLAEIISSRANNLRGDIKCTDPEIVKLKTQLEQFQKLILQLNSILSQVGAVTSTLKTVATIAKALKLIQLAIPMAPGVPSGPVTEAINIFTKLIDNVASAVLVLNNVITNIDPQFKRINALIADSINSVAAICHNEVFEVSSEISNIINNPRSKYGSEFYSVVNVSESDIQDRFVLIDELIADELNIMTNLIEAPSDVLIGITAPTNDIGNINSYYIDTVENIVYGPKTTTGWDTGVNL
jgi:hypothetical protein